jgi:TonB family protein
MLSGKHPFNSLGAVDAKRAAMRPAPLASLTTRQNQALAQALAFDRAQRTPSVEALLAGLEGTAQRRRRSLIWLVTGAAACLIAGAVTWMVWHRPAAEHARSAAQSAPPKVPSAGPVPAPIPTPTPSATAAPAATHTATPTPARKEPAIASKLPQPAPVPVPVPVPTKSKHEAVVPAVEPSPDTHAAMSAAVSPGDRPAAAVASDAESTADAAPAAESKPPESPAPAADSARPTRKEEGGPPPIGKKVAALIPLPESASKLVSCPYPEEARHQVETGTVVLLVYVSPQGVPANTQIDTSSGSTSLDQAAVTCVQENGQFAPRIVGKQGVGYWGRMKFNWSFGD